MRAIEDRVLVLDSAMGTRLIARGLDLRDDDPALWNLSHRDDVLDCHSRDVEAGSDALLTNTFGANRPNLERLGRASNLAAINRLAVELCRAAAGPDRLVLGSIGPAAALGRDGDACPAYREQAEILLDAGVDGLMIETHSYDQATLALWNLDVKATAIVVCLLSWPDDPEALRGQSGNLWFMGAEAMGTNCASIASVLASIDALRHQLAAPLIARPSAGLPGETLATPEAFATMARGAVGMGARMIGGCCGTDENHVAAIRSVIPHGS
jgi:methionine synthase I (cobalamin-dependent)